MSDRKQKLIENLVSKPGFRARVDAKCVECIYDDCGHGGTWRKQVENCTSYQCPLWDVRAKSTGGDDE